MWEVREGNVFDVLPTLASCSVQCCVTSPPYWGLRDYGVEGQLGAEKSPTEYIVKMLSVFREVRRVLRADGTLWLNLGDSYSGSGKGPTGPNGFGQHEKRQGFVGGQRSIPGSGGQQGGSRNRDGVGPVDGLQGKNLYGIPWRTALALQADGWFLRAEIIWSKPNPMPESVTDRPTRAHEQVFLLTKSERYFYNQDAAREPTRELTRGRTTGAARAAFGRAPDRDGGFGSPMEGRNMRSVWEMVSQPTKEAHFATFPEELPRRCIKLGSKEGDLVLDPFNGSGTTGLVAVALGRKYVGVELNSKYVKMTRERFSFAPPPSLNVTLREAKRVATKGSKS